MSIERLNKIIFNFLVGVFITLVIVLVLGLLAAPLFPQGFPTAAEREYQFRAELIAECIKHEEFTREECIAMSRGD